MTPRYLRYEQAAVYLDTTVPALKKRVQLGELPVIRDGRRVRFDRHDLDTHMRRQRVEAWAS